jgi:hypothetical protein
VIYIKRVWCQQEFAGPEKVITMSRMQMVIYYAISFLNLNIQFFWMSKDNGFLKKKDFFPGVFTPKSLRGDFWRSAGLMLFYP